MRCNRFSVVSTLAVVMVTLVFANAAKTALIDEDFQSPLLSNGTGNPSFTGWVFEGGNPVGGSTKSRRADNQSDVPGSTTIPNQVIQQEWTSATASYDIAHNWSTSEAYTLTLNASPQSWNGDQDRYIAPSLRQQDGTVLWSGSTLMPKYSNFGRSPWTAAQTFTYVIPGNSFTTGTEGEPLNLKIAHTGFRGIYLDNVLLTAGPPPTDNTPPTPDPSTWGAVPAAFDFTNVAMTASTAVDPYDVEYFFENTATGTSSGWQDGTLWEEHGLAPATSYTYRTKSRDKSPNQNETGWSTLESVTTPPEVPGLIFASGFQSPMYGNGTGSPNFFGWEWQGPVKSRTTAGQSDVPGDATNQTIQFEYTNQSANHDSSHAWAADEVYTLTLHASPQSWNGTEDRSIVPSLLQTDGTELWSDTVLMPHYDAFGRNPWTAAQTFTFTIPAADFITGTEGEPLRLKIASSGFRGIYVDNVMLTFAGSAVAIPEPSTFAMFVLGLLGLGWYGWRRRRPTC